MISQTGADRLLWPLAAMRRLAALAAVFLLFQATIADVEKMLATLQRYGGAESVFRDWRQLIDDSKSLEARDKLKRINEFFNRKLLFLDDIKVWGQTDYWATPLETLAKGQGDCEDFTIAKYFTLLSAGMPNEQLRLIYVKARIGGPASNVTQAHMVLAWYETPDAEPLLLDNLITDIRPASAPTDRTRRSGRCRAATSRRSCSPAGKSSPASCCCSTSPSRVSTSVPGMTSSGPSARTRTEPR